MANKPRWGFLVDASRSATFENFLFAPAPVLATSNFVASNRLLNPELPACARARPLHPGERFSRNLEAISHSSLSSPPSPVHRARRYKYVTEWCTVFRNVAEARCLMTPSSLSSLPNCLSLLLISQEWNISQPQNVVRWWNTINLPLGNVSIR